MGDLAFHEAGIALLRHFGDPRFEPPGLYRLNLGEPNQLFHLIGYALSFSCSTDWACKLIVAATIALVATGASHLASHLGVTRWGAVIVTPLAVGWMARWGLVANLLGFACLLWGLPTLLRAMPEPTPRLAARAAGLVALLYLAHEASMLLYGAFGLALAFLSPRTRRDPRALSLACAPSALAAVLATAY